MAFSLDTLASTHHLVHGQGFPVTVCGIGPATVRGSAYIEGPMVVGADFIWPFPTATVMIGPDKNLDSPPPFLPGAVIACGAWNHSPYSLHVVGDVAINNFLDVQLDINAGGFIRAGGAVIAQGPMVVACGIKPFNIIHPNKEGWRLVHNCLEGPEIAIYIRGRVKEKTEIELPDYWENLVDIDTITVNLTPIGSSQNVFVKDWDIKKVYLESSDNSLIDCFYYITVERKDARKLVVEYEGDIEDYPGGYGI